MNLSDYSTRVMDINTRRQNRLIEATAQYMQEMRSITSEAETDMQMATTELLGEEVGSTPEFTSPKEIARGLFE